jgi:class 3 adenylate cyclase
MALNADLKTAVAGIFRERWSITNGRVVPDASNLLLGSNHGIKLEATVLYADMANSTQLVDEYDAQFSAEIYKAYLHCASKIIKACEGTITAYDGDRVMGVFVGDFKNTNAVSAALMINHARIKIINPAINAQYPQVNYQVGHTIGIDTSDLLAARIGVRNDNDIVWVGRAANHAAKLCAATFAGSLRITRAVYDRLRDAEKNGNGVSMWELAFWRDNGNAPIYSSTWMRGFS